MDRRAPINIKFEIPYFTVSGIQVRYLKIVEKSGYQALREYITDSKLGVFFFFEDTDLTSFPLPITAWVRYICQNGEYDLRTQSDKAQTRLAPFAG